MVANYQKDELFGNIQNASFTFHQELGKLSFLYCFYVIFFV